MYIPMFKNYLLLIFMFVVSFLKNIIFTSSTAYCCALDFVIYKYIKCMYANIIPTIFEFRQMIKNVKFNELAIAQRNNKLELYRKIGTYYYDLRIILIELH